MSDPITEVYAGNEASYAIHGHVSAEQAIAETRRMLEHERDKSIRQLAAIDSGNVHVYHQRGVYIARNRRRVGP